MKPYSRKSLLAGICALFMLAVGPALSTTHAAKVSNKIVAINKKGLSFTVHESTHKNVTYSVNGATRVFVNGRKSTFSHLTTKMEVSVTHPADSKIVDFIDAHTLVKPPKHRR